MAMPKREGLGCMARRRERGAGGCARVTVMHEKRKIILLNQTSFHGNH